MDTDTDLLDDAALDEPVHPEDAPLDELSQEFVNRLVDKCLQFNDVLVGYSLHDYQIPFARRIVESVIIGDGEELTALAARQSGKSEVLADVLATLMVLLPRLAKIYPDLLGKFANGLWVGVFAPTEGQAQTLFGRTVSRLTSVRATEIMGDPEIDDTTAREPGAVKGIRLKKSGSTLTMMTANPRAKIESKSFHVIVIDECQEADDFTVAKSISPMLAYYAGTMVKTGTPTTSKNNFYRSIQLNKRRQTTRGARQNHFQWDYKDVAKVNDNYAKFIRREILRIGEDSDEFQLSYNCVVATTRVLTADLRYVPAGDLKVGDRLVGFDEERPGKGLHRQFRESVVTSAARVIRPSYRVSLSDGTTVTSSDGHLWLVSTVGRRTLWKTTADLTTTDRIFKVCDVWDTEASYEAGYLSAAFDGEGHIARRPDGQITGMSFTQKDNPMREQVTSFLGRLRYQHWVTKPRDNGVSNVGLSGGRAAVMRFLGSIRPPRLLGKFSVDALGSIGRHDHKGQAFEHPRVVAKTFLGDIEVVALETTTKTFIAEGLASHNCKWLLERGMFVTSGTMDELGDTSQEVVKSWFRSAVVVGVDPARKMDSTVVTVVWVDWDRPDEFGYYDHRVLNWLELTGDDWEEQYFQITNFLSQYDVLAVGVDANGVGDAVAQRLKILLPRAEVVAITSSPAEQSKRFKHLQALIQRKMVGWPSHAKTRRLRTYKRFRQQMEDAELNFKGPNIQVAAPDEAHAHDDYVDSLAIACSLTADLTMPTVEASEAPWFRR